MRSTVVPAQITTVEDRIAGGLGMSQILLLTVPVFGGSALFVILPPFLSYATYKVVAIAMFAAICGLLAIRIKSRILLSWLVILLRYNMRPRYYVFSKNSMYLREQPASKKAIQTVDEIKQPQKIDSKPLPTLSTQQLARIQNIITDPNTNLRFTFSKKGRLRAHFTQSRS